MEIVSLGYIPLVTTCLSSGRTAGHKQMWTDLLFFILNGKPLVLFAEAWDMVEKSLRNKEEIELFPKNGVY